MYNPIKEKGLYSPYRFKNTKQLFNINVSIIVVITILVSLYLQHKRIEEKESPRRVHLYVDESSTDL